MVSIDEPAANWMHLFMARTQAHFRQLKPLEIVSIAATFKNCRKERRDISNQEKRGKAMEGFSKEQRRFWI